MDNGQWKTENGGITAKVRGSDRTRSRRERKERQGRGRAREIADD